MPAAPSYSAVTFTVTELLNEVRDMAAVPTSSQWTDAKILSLADQSIASILTEPVVQTLGLSGRWLDYEDILVSDGMRSGAEYWVPNLSASGTISHVDYYTSSTADPERLMFTTAEAARDVDTLDGTTSSAPTHCYFRDGRLVVLPTPTSPTATARVRIWYPAGHPKLVVTTDNVGTASSVDTDTNVITLSATHPSGWPAAPYAVDIYSAYSPHTPLVRGLGISSDSGADITYSEPIVGESDLSILGTDFYVALAGTSDCVQLPSSMRAALLSRTASRLLAYQGDAQGANQLWGISQEELASSRQNISPRSKASPPVFVNRHSPARARFRRLRNWGNG